MLVKGEDKQKFVEAIDLTAEELFEEMIEKYGDDFNWMIVPLCGKMESVLSAANPIRGVTLWAEC